MVQGRSAKQAHRLKVAFALAGVYLVAEVVASSMTGSLALLAIAHVTIQLELPGWEQRETHL